MYVGITTAKAKNFNFCATQEVFAHLPGNVSSDSCELCRLSISLSVSLTNRTQGLFTLRSLARSSHGVDMQENSSRGKLEVSISYRKNAEEVQFV